MVRLNHVLKACVLSACLPLAWGETLIQGSGSTFIMQYDELYDTTYQSLMNDAAQFWADSVRSTVPITVEVKAVNNMNCSLSYNSHSDTQPPAAAINFANAPLADTYYPVALANAFAGEDLLPATADITIRYNRKLITHSICPKWYLEKDGNYNFLQYSLYFETLQEIAHGLGLIPLGDLMTGQRLNGVNDVYWTHLKSEASGQMITEMTAAEVDTAAHQSQNLAFKGERSWQAAEHLDYGRTSDALLLFSRSYDADKLTGFHLYESVTPKQLMMVDIHGTIPETELAVAMLEDLGWQSTRNAMPVVSSQFPLSVDEDSPLTLSLNDFTVIDEDPTSLTLTLQPGAHYGLNGKTITPEANFNGVLTVPVVVDDGELTSAVFYTEVTVNPVNDAPSITAQTTLALDEDSDLTLTTANLTISDIDSTLFTLTVLAGEHYQFDGTRVIPTANYHGELTVPVQVSDGEANSPVKNLTVTVRSINDAPVISGQQRISVEEETPLLITTTMLTIADVDSSAFTLSVLPGSFYRLSGNRITPDENYNGDLTIPVQVSDGESSSNTFQLSVSVIPKNDPPVVMGWNPIQIDEDNALELTPALVSFTDVDSSEFYLVAQAGDHYQVTNGWLTPEENFAGTLSVPMQISDTTSLSNTVVVTVEVLPVNDAPMLESIADQHIYEDSSLFVSEDILSIVDPDNSSFTVSIARGEHYQVAANEIIPNTNWYGELAIDITVSDGDASSNTQTLNLTVMPVNDLPELTTSVLPSAHIYRSFEVALTATDIDDDVLSFSLKDAPAWLTLTDDGTLTAYPNENMIGDHRIDVGVSDGTATVYSSLTLSILDDPTATDLSATLTADRTIWSTKGWVPVTVNLYNQGPMSEVNAQMTIQFAGEWSSQDARCSVSTHRCAVDLNNTDNLTLSVRMNKASTVDLTVSLSHIGYEITPDNNQSRLTLTFSDSLPVSPQYTVPNFGQGTVRAIGIADIQGGRWPEILFANGATEASTAYKFEKSLFRPVLHTHLADASNSYAMAIFDIDNDGDNDWILANGDGEANTIYRNTGEGYFEMIGALGHYDSRAVAYGDLDRDGDLDLVFANNDDPNTLYLNQGDGSFELYKEFESFRSRAVLIHDFNRDGRPDIVFANRGFRNRILFNRGFRQAGLARSVFGRSISSTDSGFDATEFGGSDDLTANLTLADLDGDGEATDLITVNDASDNQSASLQVFNVIGDESTQLTNHSETGTVTDISVGDYDGDGKDDLAVLRPGGALEVMSQQGNGLNTIEVMDTDGADTILMVDVDGSGQADVISANNRSDSSRLDFAGSVMDDEQGDGSIAVTLPETAGSAALPSTSNRASKGGAGMPLLLLPVLLFWRRKTTGHR